jgi:DNA-binding LacI/PurR family transcriptional regulator
LRQPRAAGVSRTTASAALSGSGRISEATRDHIRAVAAELGYVPNPAARHLRTGRKGALGVYIAEGLIPHAFYMAYTFGVAEAAREDGFAVTLIVAPPDQMLASAVSQVDGVIVPDPMPGDPVVERLLRTAVPVIASERYLGPGPPPRVTVWTDYEVATRNLLDHLWDRGARRPLLFSAVSDMPVLTEIKNAYYRWCTGRGVRRSDWLLAVDFDPDTIRTQARRLLAAPDRPDAVLAGADGFALPILQIAQELGLTVGTDLLVASCIDNPLLRSVPGITAIEAPPRDIGRDAGRALLDILRGQDVPSELRRQEPTIALRGSTAGPVLTHRTAGTEPETDDHQDAPPR